jgi:hypothetical protein
MMGRLRDFVIRRVCLGLVFTASLGVAAAAPGVDVYVAGETLDHKLAIEHVTPDGKITEVFNGGKPSAWRWIDAHTLVELFQDDKDETDLAMIVDGQPAPQRLIKVDTATWPPEAKDWPQRLAVHQGQVWLIREPAPSGKSKTKPAKPVFRRVDVTPNVTQREPPARALATVADEKRAWLDGLPSVKPPKGLSVTRTKARIGRQTWGTVRCKPAKGVTTAFPTAAVPPVLRISVDTVKFVSPTLPLYVVSGMASAAPGGPRFQTAAFQGCANAALHTLAWGGGDVFVTIAGTPDGAGFSKQDKRTLQLWLDGRAVAELPLLGEPALSSAAAPRAP